MFLGGGSGKRAMSLIEEKKLCNEVNASEIMRNIADLN